MTDISVIILIGQEKIHLGRCLERLAPLAPKCIWLIESQPDDGGVAIAKETAAKYGLTIKTVYNKWPGLQSAQFNWALDYMEKKDRLNFRSDLLLRHCRGIFAFKSCSGTRIARASRACKIDLNNVANEEVGMRN